MNSKDFFGALFLGASIGVVAGILLAPAKGSDTLKKLTGSLKDKFNQFKADAEDLADNVESASKKLVNKSTNFEKDYLHDSEEKLNGLKTEFNTTNS